MNVFVIPSWYPSEAQPHAGIFFKEQASYISESYPEINIGISTWGQNDEELTFQRKGFRSLPRRLKYYLSLKPLKNIVEKNFIEYYKPTVTWSDRILRGNIKGIADACLYNLTCFEKEKGKVALIHAHVSYPAGYVAMLISQRTGIPYIITEHMGPFPFKQYLNQDGSLKNEVALPLQKASRVIAVSPSLQNKISNFGIPTPVFIPNVVNEDFFTLAPIRRKNSHFTFFAFGSIQEEKGFSILLKSFAAASKLYPLLALRIGGNGSSIDYFKSLATELGIATKIKWLGALTRAEAREEYQNADAFILPSLLETFGVVYAEAIACGKPLIATKCGGPECIVNEKNGLLAEVGDIDDLTNKILLLIRNYKQYSATAIREDFEARFSKKAVIPQIITTYKEIIARECAA